MGLYTHLCNNFTKGAGTHLTNKLYEKQVWGFIPIPVINFTYGAGTHLTNKLYEKVIRDFIPIF